MPHNTNIRISRKLDKQGVHKGEGETDFVARLSAEKLLQCVVQSSLGKNKNDKNALLLYERDVSLADGIQRWFSSIDQVPFKAIREKPGQLESMLAAEQYTLLLSNLAFDWVDAGEFIALMDYLLLAEGQFWFSCYGPQTAANTRGVLSELDQYAHFNDYYDIEDIGDALLGAGFKEVVLESSVVNIEYHSVGALLADATRVFGVNSNTDKRTSMTPKRVLREFKQRVQEMIDSEGVFSEQVEVLIAHGKKANVPRLGGVIPVRQPG